MGVPVVTLSGPTLPSRLAASLMMSVRLGQWVASNDDEYVEIAMRAAGDLRALARRRSQLRATLFKSKLGDAHRYAREVEKAFREMWRRWCAQAGPGR